MGQNPFYEMDMPIRLDLFNQAVDKLVIKTNPAIQGIIRKRNG